MGKRVLPTTFPLWLHKASGCWCRTINGKRIYFGRDKDAAYAEYMRRKDYLNAGQDAPPDAATLKDLLSMYLDLQEAQLRTGEIDIRHFTHCKATADHLAATLGLNTRLDLIGSAECAKLLRSWAHLAPSTRRQEASRIKGIFLMAHAEGLVERPIRHSTLKLPSMKSLRKYRAAQPKKLLTRDEIHEILKYASPQMKAATLLGINVGYGDTDIALHTPDMIKGEWLDTIRHKTSVHRRGWLWPETLAAIKAYLPHRPEPARSELDDHVFLTSRGNLWVCGTKNTFGREFSRLMDAVGIEKRDRVGFYALKHTFMTEAARTGDETAAKITVGLSQKDIALSHYIERFPDERLKAVSRYMRQWLFGKRKKAR